MTLRPLGHRILVKPDEQPTETDAGLVLPDAHDHVPVSGIVVAIGKGPARDQRIRQQCIARCIGIVQELTDSSNAAAPLVDEMDRYKSQVEQYDGSIAVGDRVVFPVECGQALTEDGETMILLNEDDVVVIVTDANEAAA